jgi:succinate dehydrogenase / fumarate reductase cytochrome b subunit
VGSQIAAPTGRGVVLNRVVIFWRSTIGKKIVMAVTGLIMVAFVIAHMVGNLQIFMGPEKINSYAHFLHHIIGELLWIQRVVLLAAVVLHVTAAIQLTRIDNAARPLGYARKQPQASTFASRTIRWGGVILAIFIVVHILHFTTGTIRPAPFIEGNIYSTMVGGFQIWWVTLFYVVAMVALGLHLYHGVWSSIRTLGAVRPSTNPFRRNAAFAIAVIVWAGFTVVPLAIFFGLVR